MVFLLMFFIPRFSQMFAEFGGSLPALTRAIVMASHLLVRYWFVLVLLVALGVFGIRRALSSEEGRRVLERITLQAPLFGRVISSFALVRFSRMLGTLVGSGVPLVAALRVAKEAIGNQVLADTVSGAIDDVQRGTGLARSLEGCSILFPGSVIEIKVAGAAARRERVSAASLNRNGRYLKMAVTLIEPALLFVMAALVGTVVIGMLLPIFSLQQLIR
jgi:type II secretory pathway component PulF